MTYLPLVHLLLLRLVLLQQILQNFLETFRVCLQRWYHILHRPLHQHAVNHAETLPILGEGLQSLENQPSATDQCCP